MGFPSGSVKKKKKKSSCNTGVAGDKGSIPRSGRFPGGRYGNSLQYSCLENPMDRGAWQATVHRVGQNRTRLSDLACAHTWERNRGSSVLPFLQDAFRTKLSLHFLPGKMNQNLQSSFVSWLQKLPHSFTG